MTPARWAGVGAVVLLAVLALQGCGTCAGCVGVSSVGWEPQIVCPTQMGRMYFEAAPAGGCLEPQAFYTVLNKRVLEKLTGGDFTPFQDLEIWVWNRDMATPDAIARTNAFSGVIWMDRCLIGLVHEQLHVWEIRRRGVPPIVSAQHGAWKTDPLFKEADTTWQLSADRACPRLAPVM